MDKANTPQLNMPPVNILPTDENVNGYCPDNRQAGSAPVSADNNGHDLPSVVNNDVADAGAGEAINADELVAKFLEIVSERTGYPPEMLDLNLDMEADLGIDSIKRVEVLSTFRKLLPEDTQKQMEGSVEKLAGTKTLQAIIDWIRAFIAETSGAPIAAAESLLSPAGSGVAAPIASEADKPVRQTETISTLSRATVQLIELPNLVANKVSCPGVIVITDDEMGVAEEILQMVGRANQRAVILKQAKDTQVLGNDRYRPI